MSNHLASAGHSESNTRTQNEDMTQGIIERCLHPVCSALGRPITSTVSVGMSYGWTMGGVWTRVNGGWVWNMGHERDVFEVLPAGGEWWPNALDHPQNGAKPQ